jgi:hypothetical protein
MREAMDKASGAKTPWNPSRKAVARVTNPLPAPTTCPHCASQVELVNNQRIYGKPYGEWPWAYLCGNTKCGAYVGLHPLTNIPLGTLADAATRAARQRAKAAFNPRWQSAKPQEQRKARIEAYAWLAQQLGIADVNTCHIGWFDVAMCERVVEVCGGQRSDVDVAALVATARRLDDECLLCLSGKQMSWLEDIFESADAGETLTANSIKFLTTIASGFYTQGERA